MENKFEKLNDRITALSNQNKQSQQPSTDSIFDINETMNNLRTELNRKSNTILSKSQTIFDQLKVTTDLVRYAPNGETCNKSSTNGNTQNRKYMQSKTVTQPAQGQNQTQMQIKSKFKQITLQKIMSNNSRWKIGERK